MKTPFVSALLVTVVALSVSGCPKRESETTGTPPGVPLLAAVGINDHRLARHLPGDGDGRQHIRRRAAVDPHGHDQIGVPGNGHCLSCFGAVLDGRHGLEGNARGNLVMSHGPWAGKLVIRPARAARPVKATCPPGSCA